jgi:serine/threonine protein kinase
LTLRTGAALGPYLILGSLGAGGMGEVYKARDTRMDREVAVKTLSPRLASSTQATRRFEREIKAVAALSHRNIVTIYDCGSQGGIRYAVTELLEGETLSDRLKRGVMMWREALGVGIAVADGLSVAHRKSIIHRDIKPGNLFMTSSGDVKILDFGLARFLQSVSDTRVDTQEHSTVPFGVPSAESGSHGTNGCIVGTVDYMSPEQAAGEPAEIRSDIFSLGCVLYEMLSGTKPFLRGDPVETLHAIIHEEAPPLRTPNGEWPPALERTVSRCMEKMPARRFQTAQDLSVALSTILERTPRGLASASGGHSEPAVEKKNAENGEETSKKKASNPQWRQAQELFNHAAELYKRREFHLALGIFQQLRLSYPNEVSILYPEAMCLAAVRRLKEAESLLHRLNGRIDDSKVEKLRRRIEGMRSDGSIEETPPLPPFPADRPIPDKT